MYVSESNTQMRFLAVHKCLLANPHAQTILQDNQKITSIVQFYSNFGIGVCIQTTICIFN